jgi:hypothetical protein
MARSRSRPARSVRLPGELWRALDEAALRASARSSRYISANALLETIVAAELGQSAPREAAANGLERMRAARRAKRAQDEQRVARQLAIVRRLGRTGEAHRRLALAEARAIVARWRDAALASPLYVEAWSELLDRGPSAIAQALRRGHRGLSPAALASNSPLPAAPPDRGR